MRKRLKIKALLIFISWAVFFSHSLIPHSHKYTDHLLRDSSCSNHDVHAGDITLSVSEQTCEEEGACSIIALVFHNSNNDQPFACVPGEANPNFGSTVQYLAFHGHPEKIPLVSAESIFLRGPPAV